jgi:putative tryptophan/tyrosine transport system substrate-binding protein
MRRRELIMLLGGAATTWPLAARAQQKKMPLIGFLCPTTAAIWAPWTAAFVQRLTELGWIDGRTISIEYGFADGHEERYGEIAAKFVDRKVDVIVTGGSAVPAVKRMTSTIPIVFAIGRDPLGEGYVASLSRPGGNVTGLSLQLAELAGKRLELLREVLPNMRTLAALADAGDSEGLRERTDLETAAHKVGLETFPVDIRKPDDIAPAIDGAKDRAEALYICSGVLANTNRSNIYATALAAQLPTISGVRVMAESGCLLSYGTVYADLFRRAGDLVDKILNGVKPADIPVEQPTKFELVVNLKTAKALGLRIPPNLLALADEVIE